MKPLNEMSLPELTELLHLIADEEINGMGYKVSGTTIQITRGDSGYFRFIPYTVDAAGTRTEYVPHKGD